MNMIYFLIAAALVAALCPIASVYAQNDTGCNNAESNFERIICETDIIFGAREALP